MRRVVVVGTTGSGKSTFSRALAAQLRVPYVELDSLQWEANWKPAERAAFRQGVFDRASTDEWVIDGNYSAVRDVTWGRADTLVWLDYPLWLVLSRLARRTVRRIVTREVLWNGNQEHLAEQLSRNSLLVWAVTSHRRRRRQYPQAFKSGSYVHLKVVRLRSPRDAHVWLDRVAAATPDPVAVPGRRALLQSGQGIVEYALIIFLVAVAVAALLTTMGAHIETVFSSAATAL